MKLFGSFKNKFSKEILYSYNNNPYLVVCYDDGINLALEYIYTTRINKLVIIFPSKLYYLDSIVNMGIDIDIYLLDMNNLFIDLFKQYGIVYVIKSN